MTQPTTQNEFNGLTSHQAEMNLKKFGHNSVKVSNESVFFTFLKQFLSPLIYLLILACVLSFALGNYTDAVVILIIIFINSTLGFLQQYKVNREFKKLSTYITSNIEVLRDGSRKLIPKAHLVPGDIVFLKLGDIIPADCLVLKVEDLEVDESTLTGEADNVTKVVNKNADTNDSKAVLYSGTHIVKGSVIAKIFATGAQSKFGTIAQLSIQTKKISEYEINLQNMSKKFLVVSVIALAGIFFAHILFKEHEDVVSLLLFTVAISITIIPEALPIIANLTLARSASKLGKSGVIVKRAAAIEDLGNIDLICSDKTGTLTKNLNSVSGCHVGKSKEKLWEYVWLLAFESPDQIDVALTKYLQVQNFQATSELKNFIQQGFEDIPFDPVKKRSSRNFKDFKIVKGTVEYINQLTNYSNTELGSLQKKSGNAGLRSISLALVKGAHAEYLGTFFLEDEIKEDAAEVIKRAENLGITLKIITGDSLEVSRYVGKKVGLIQNDDQVIESRDLKFDDSAFFEEQVFSHSIFTRCDPVQKYKIIQVLQKKHFVGYLGDGINDSPSLKLANVSIVVNSASDIAKESADLVLLTKNLNVLINGIHEGRKAFENIDKYLRQTLAGNFGNFFTIGVISLFINYLPMLPIQILISNLLTDIPSLAISRDNVEKSELKKPKLHDLNLVIRHTFWFAALSSVFDILLFIIILNYPVNKIQTLWFAFSTISEIAVLLSLRTTKGIFSKSASKPSKILVASIILTLALTLFAIIFGIPALEIEKIPLELVFVIITGSLIYVAANEGLKKILYKKAN